MIKGNVLVGQSGGCTAVINQSLAGVIETCKTYRDIGTIWGMRNGITGVLANRLCDLTRLTSQELAMLKNTPSSALGSCRHKISAEDCPRIFDVFKKRNIRYVFLIGGNDSAQTSALLSAYAEKSGYQLNVIAVPKTIDNDLPCMDHTPGYGSAARFIACTTQEAGRDTESMKDVDPVKIIEVMGRNSGWLVASSVLGKRSKKDAPHLLYFPERPFDVEQFLRDVKRVYEEIGYVVVVMSETIRDKHGKRVGERTEGITQDSFGHKYMDSAAAKLARLVEERLHIRARYDKPGSILRMSMGYISPVDQKEAYGVGAHAVRIARQGKTGMVTTIERVSTKPYRVKYGAVPIDAIAGVEKYLPTSFISKEGTFVTKAFVRYAAPLVGPIPSFIRL